MKSIKVIKLKGEADIGLRKLRRDASIIYKWGKGKYYKWRNKK